MIKKVHRGRGRPRKNPLPDSLGINIIITKKQPPPASKFDPRSSPLLRWHNKRSRTPAVAIDGRRTTPSSSSSSNPPPLLRSPMTAFWGPSA
ncbi:unnamed protein product [Linum trigynum]|uniref:Uncharacterized protein n=1 Tax=Linum trigynum TaxID=586398 RepID=A0AAV2G711_9ROSI